MFSHAFHLFLGQISYDFMRFHRFSSWSLIGTAWQVAEDRAVEGCDDRGGRLAAEGSHRGVPPALRGLLRRLI